MKLFELRREVDETGVSGTGTVAQGVIFDNGKCALTWLTQHTSVALYDSIDAVVAIHGHDGRTKVVQIIDGDRARWEPTVTTVCQDHIENVACGGLDDMAEYLWKQREKFCDLFNEKRLDG